LTNIVLHFAVAKNEDETRMILSGIIP